MDFEWYSDCERLKFARVKTGERAYKDLLPSYKGSGKSKSAVSIGGERAGRIILCGTCI